MSKKNNAVTTYSREKIGEICGCAKTTLNAMEAEQLTIVNSVKAISDKENFDGPVAESVCGTLDNISKIAVTLVQKFAALERVSNAMGEFAAAQTAKTSASINENKDNMAARKMAVDQVAN